ncbi:hypothetical protein FE257_005726 [Aspergillus nanangensis]|uniref:Uncharacterized protein n=1 Tax=Aspergillus nanangensis TaxID=2582783 RepID=A0AAD4CQ12_ASPNN|nr:hypothetical protein FE257_005726 [Aspergillus nanangensis]
MHSLKKKRLTVAESDASKIVALESRLDEADLGLDPCALEKGLYNLIRNPSTPPPRPWSSSAPLFQPLSRRSHRKLQKPRWGSSRPCPWATVCPSGWGGTDRPSFAEHGRPCLFPAHRADFRSLPVGSVERLRGDSAADPIGPNPGGVACDGHLLAQDILEVAASCLKRAETTCGDGRSSTDDRTDSGAKDGSVYNIVNLHPFTWAALLDQLQQHGWEFNVVPFATWLQWLEASAGENTNPAVVLIPHYRTTYGPGGRRNTQRDSKTLRHGSTDLLAGGVLGHYARDWLDRWGAPRAMRLKAPSLSARPQVDRA